MHNVARTRELYKAVRLHLQQGFKSDGDGQSGWEERCARLGFQPVRPGATIVLVVDRSGKHMCVRQCS
eukprot:341296-Prymnesium_polylepis.2